MNRLLSRAAAHLRAPIHVLFFALLLAHVGTPPATAGSPSGISLTLSKSHNAPSPVPSGQVFTFTLAYGWSGGAPGTLVITDTLPADFVVVSTLPSTPPSGSSVTFTLTGLASTGGAGTVQINAKFKPGVTCNGANACNDASIQVVDDPTSLVKSNTVCVTASAQNKWTFGKHLIAGCALDNDVIFLMCITQPSGGDIGGMNLTNVVLTDAVPAGAVVTSVSGSWPAFTQTGTTVTFSGGPTTLPVSAWNVSYCEYVHVTFPSTSFAVGQTVTNSATLAFDTPCGGAAPQQLTGSANATLCVANPSGAIWKGLAINMSFPTNNAYYAPSFSPGCCGTYTLAYTNNGNVPQPAPFDLVDDVPQELDVTAIRTQVPAFSSVQVDVFTWNGAGPCTLYAGVGFPLVYNSAGTQTATALPPNVCKVRWRYASAIPIAANLHNYLDVCVRTNGFQPPFAPVVAGQNVVNTVTAPNNQPGSISASNTKPVDAFQPHILAAKFFVGAWGPNCQIQNAGPFVPGNTVRWRMAIANVGNMAATPCVITDTLPAYLTYAGNPTYYYGVVNSMANTWNPPCGNLTPAVPPQIGGVITSPAVGSGTLAWGFPTLPFRCNGTVEYLIIEFDVTIGSAPPAPPGNYPNTFTFTAGNLATAVTSNVATLTVNGTAQLTILKEVRELPNGTFSTSATVPAGSSVEFRLRVTNTGNLPLANLCLLDVMPHVGDVLALSGAPAYPARSSTFDLPSDGPVTASISGFVPGYNTSANTKNPTRSATCLGFCGSIDPANGVAPLTNGSFGSTAATTFSTTVSGGTTPLASAAVLDVLIPATIPSTTPIGAIACNNFAIRALPVGTQTCLVTQSNVACVHTIAPVDVGRICIRKFDDLNGNGVLDAGEPGLAGFTFLLTDAGGVVATLVTPASGLVCHPGAGLTPGTYTASELAHAGWTPTTPVTQSAPYVTGQTTTFVFGNKRCGSGESGKLCVHKFEDLNGNGIEDAGEPGLPGWHFTVTLPSGLQQSVVTDGHGTICFAAPVGLYGIVEVPQAGWTATTPTTQSAGVTAGQVTGVSFGNRKSGGGGGETGKLCVFKFLDENGSGRQDPGEGPLSGWTFEVRDSAGNVVATLTTNGEGVMCTGLPAGTYTVTELPQAGYAATTPTTQIVTVTAGQQSDAHFGNRKSGGGGGETGKLCVFKFLDENGSGRQDPGEGPLSGWTFQVRDSAGNVVATLTTNGEGIMCTGLPAGTYTVTEVPQAGYTATTPTTRIATVIAGQQVDVAFGNRKTGGGGDETGKLCVFKFLDENGNGRQDPGEGPLANWTFVVRNASGAVVTTLTTDERGIACTALRAGTYVVAESPQPGYTATTPAVQSVTVTAGQLTTATFGNRKSGGLAARGELCVHKFLDSDGNGTQERGEPSLPGWTFQVRDAAGTVVATLTTGANGTMCVALPAGPYTVTEVPQPGYTATTPTTQTATVTGHRTVTLTFGNRKGR